MSYFCTSRYVLHGRRFIFAQMNNSKDRIFLRLVYKGRTQPRIEISQASKMFVLFPLHLRNLLGFRAPLWSHSWKNEVECTCQQNRHFVYHRGDPFSEKMYHSQFLLWVELSAPTLSYVLNTHKFASKIIHPLHNENSCYQPMVSDIFLENYIFLI